jgi:hypothetical protein
MFWVPLNLGEPPNKIALPVGRVTACNFKEIRELLKRIFMKFDIGEFY